jgi:RNA ligase partner protein|uniref:RNA-free ribonuclease P n=1 Tax=Fervidicoccus fontis TaxID=683846 RepID=A0A7C1E6C6_9CREN
MHAEKSMIFVLDTSLFTDNRLRDSFLALTTEEALDKLAKLLEQARILIGPVFYTTPTVQTELRRILLSSGIPVDIVSRLEAWIIPKSPDKFSLNIPSIVMWEYIMEMRRRYVKALKISEEYVKKSCSDKREIGKLIHELREKFRETIRKGIIDSPEDFDVLLLAFELKGVIVSNDEGIKKLGRTLGIITLDSQSFVETLKRLVEAFQRYLPKE